MALIEPSAPPVLVPVTPSSTIDPTSPTLVTTEGRPKASAWSTAKGNVSPPPSTEECA